VTALRVLFADDEEMARVRLRRLLESAGGVEIVCECRSGEEALRMLEAHAVDVALLDVRMGVVSGLEVADAAADLGVEIILTTAHADHAVAAFEKGALDYLLKPIDEQRLAEALGRARARITPPHTPAAMPIERLPIASRGEIVLVAPGSVSHAISDGRLVTVTTSDRELLTELTLADLLRHLPHLLRVHRRAVLALEHVDRLQPQPSGGYLAKMRGGQVVPVSRQEARQLRRRLGIR
jgi:two-component system, LytTR family, response regulator